MAVPNSFDDFSDRFNALQEEARRFGVCTVVALMEDDPIRMEETRTFHRHASWSVAMGLTEYVKSELLRASRGDE